MDSHAVQPQSLQQSISLVEGKYRELCELGERRSQAWEQEKQALLEKISLQEEQLSAQQELLAEAQEESELTLQQLNQAQEDLEQHLLDSRGNEQTIKDLREESELILLQLHQVQEELEQVFLASQGKDQTIQKLRADLKKSTKERDQTATQSQGKDQTIQKLRAELQAKVAEVSLTVKQLHQMQADLEHSLRVSRAADDLAQAQQQQLSRAQELVGRLLPSLAIPAESLHTPAIEVISPEALAPAALSVQTDALLNSYAASLERAAALLQRSMKR